MKDWLWSDWNAHLEPSLDPLEGGSTQERHAAVAIVLRPGPHRDVLFMVRAPGDGDPWSGQVSFPGGHHESTDKDLLTTAIRETHEEVGLRLDHIAHPIGRLPDLQASARGRVIPLTVTPFVFVQKSAGELDLGPEASHAFRIPLQPLLHGELNSEKIIRTPKITKRYPAWQYEDWIVWGMTCRIMQGLLDRVHDLGGWPQD